MGTIANRVEELLGLAVVATTPVAGGDICTATRVRLSDGRSAFVKTRPRAPADFFAAEARGLDWLRVEGGPPLPEVLAVSGDFLVLSWIEEGRPGTDGVESFAHQLATMHGATLPEFGAQPDGYIGTVPLPNGSTSTWPEFWAIRRVLPYLKVARDRDAISPEAAGAIERVTQRIDEFAGPPEPPARLHGDLWSGNVLWSGNGSTYLVDPAAYAGHRETDLAMLSLFGAPQLTRIVDAYDEHSPLAEGWRERVPLHQIHPLLIHAILFGGSYGERAGSAARSVLDGKAAA